MNSLNKPVAILMLLTLTLIIFITPTQADDTATLTVKVLTADGKPLKNAHLEIKNSTNNEVVTTGETGSDGEASFNLELYNYSITVYYPEGHEVGSEHVNLDETKTVTISVNVISKWTIRVYDKKERDPVKGANVTITHQGDPSIKYWKLTDENGKAEFGPIPCDSNYKVLVKFRESEYDEGAKSPIDGEVTVTLPLYRVILTILDKKNSPVEGVEVKLREELDQEPIASAMSESDGKAILKLIPNGKYYIEAWLKGVKVYESDGKEISVLNDDVAKTLIVDAVKLNITVLDYDGENVMKNYFMKGELIRNGEVIAEAESIDGILHFGHTPFETYQLKIMLGDLELYSGEYAVDLETAEGSVKAWFYDITLEVNASRLVNASLAKSLTGRLTAKSLVFEFKTEEWEAKLKDIPRSEDYKVELFYKDKPIAVIEPIRVTEDNQIVKLNLTGYKILVTTLNLDGKPVSADLRNHNIVQI